MPGCARCGTNWLRSAASTDYTLRDLLAEALATANVMPESTRAFEEAPARLDRLVRAMEDNSIGLAAVTALHGRPGPSGVLDLDPILAEARDQEKPAA